MNKLKTGLGLLLGLFSAVLLFDGVQTIVATSGVVRGSEFGMLITLTNKLGYLTVWLAFYTFWRLAPAPVPALPKAADSANTADRTPSDDTPENPPR